MGEKGNDNRRKGGDGTEEQVDEGKGKGEQGRKGRAGGRRRGMEERVNA